MRASTKHQSATWASDVHTFCPVITHSPPSRRGGGGHGRQVRPGARLGVALAPQLLDRHDRRQEPALLLRRAERDQRRPEQFLAQVADPGGRAAAGVLLVEDDLLRQRGARARRARPASPGRSSRRRPGAGSRPAARRAPRARGPGRPRPRSAANRPVRLSASHCRDAAAELLVLRAELHPGLPAPGPRVRRLGRPLALGWPAAARARRLSLPSTCLLEGALGGAAPSRPRWPARPGSSATRRRWPSRAARGSATAQLHERVATVARALIAEGVAPGDRVAIWSPNTHHWVLGALGALYAGATAGPGQHPVHRP